MEDIVGKLASLYWVTMVFFLILVGFWSFTYILKFLQTTHKPLPPGPPGLPLIGHLHMLGDLPHRTLYRLSTTYGPIMHLRLGLAPTVVVSSAEAAELFLKTHDINFVNRPKMQAADYLSYGSRGVGFSEYGPYWRYLRKLYTTHLLSISKMESFRPLRKEELKDLVKDLMKSQGREVVNISVQVSLVVQKITYRMILGTSNEEMFNFKPCIQEGLNLAGVFNIADYIPFTKALGILGMTRRLKNVGKVMDDLLEKIVNQHENVIDKQEHHRDFVDIMLSLMKSNNAREEKIDRINIKAMVLDMLGGALATSASTIEWALSELVRHPQVMKQVQEELVSVVGLDRMVEESDLSKLPYLYMVIKETMRLHPVAPLLIPRESIEDMSIKGFNIPKRSRIIINAFAIGRDPTAWPNKTEEFYPERFINSDVDVRGLDIQLIPFGSGRRKCVGIELGIRTVQFVLAQIVHCFNLELPDGMSPKAVDMKERFGLAVPRANPLFLVPTYRLHVENL